ncbi:MAG: hypothetical protein ABJL99_25740 [Aliishimia sp.]
MKPIFLSLVAIAISTPCAFAEPAMSAQDFETYTLGKTLIFGRNGQAYGAEQYLQNRSVVWSFLDGQCKEGYWYPEGDNICFIYEDNPDSPQCWSFEQSARGLIAQFQDGSMSEPLYEAQDSSEDMVCLGPETGV